jgi:hypothetical protein
MHMPCACEAAEAFRSINKVQWSSDATRMPNAGGSSLASEALVFGARACMHEANEPAGV